MSAKIPSSLQVCIKVRPCEADLTSLWQVNEGRSIHLAESHAEPYVFGECSRTITDSFIQYLGDVFSVPI